MPEIVQQAKSGIPFCKAEEAVIGANHQEIGVALTEKWKFPRSFQFVSGYHHAPEELAKENRLLSVVTHISDVICARQGIGLKITADTETPKPELLDEIGLSFDQLEQISNNIDDELETVRALIE